MDYLAPYLARLGEPEQLSLHNKQQLREDCLRDLRVQLVDLANIIQARFEEVGTLSDCTNIRIYIHMFVCTYICTYVQVKYVVGVCLVCVGTHTVCVGYLI